jgi:hypothetical protein
MTTAQFVQRLIRDRVDAFQDECDLWRQEYQAAQLYFDWRDLLHEGVELYHELCRLDENWRRDVYCGGSYEEDFAQRVDELFRRLGRAMFTIEKDLVPLYEREHGTHGAEEFRKCCREIRGILTPDQQFFAGDALTALRDQALDQMA